MSQRIVIRTPNHLGDTVMALPMINEVREAHPGSHVHVLTPAPLADLFHHNANIDEIVPIPAEHVHGLMSVVKIRELLGGREYDTAYILPPSFGSAAAFKLASIPVRIGYIADGRRLLLSKPLPLPNPLNAEHRAETYFNLLRRSVGQELSFVRPKLFLNDADLAAAAQVLHDFGISDDHEYAVIACQAVAESRRWGVENYTELTKYLLDNTSLSILLIGAREEQQAAYAIETTLDDRRVVNVAGRTSLRESAALLSRSVVFIGNDSGPAHLAAAVGAPVVVLSGADDPRETSPLTDRKELIYLDHLDCISCVKNRCPLQGDNHMACMRGISLTTVVDALRALLPDLQTLP